MDCRSTRRNAAAAALGALAGPELAEMLRHLACCPGCHADFERARRAVDLAENDGTISSRNAGALIRRISAAGRVELERQRPAGLWERIVTALLGACSGGSESRPCGLRPD